MYFPFLLLFAVINPLLMINFQDILRMVKPQFLPLKLSEVFPRPILYLLYVPTNPVLTKMFKGIPYPKEIRSFTSTISTDPIIDDWKNLKVFEYTYLNFNIQSFFFLENVNKDELSTYNMTNTDYRIVNLSYASKVVSKYGTDVSISRNGKSIYLALLHVIKMALFALYPGTVIPEITITGLPNSVFHEIHWPIIQLLFYYCILGCLILHLKTIRRLSKESIIHPIGWYSVINYISIFVLYQSLCLIVHISTSLTLCTNYFNSRIIHNLPWYGLVFVFLINSNTIVSFSMALCELDMSTYNMLYFLGMIMAPQMLYSFTFCQTDGINCYFQYLTCLSPILAISWSLTSLESLQTEFRFYIGKSSIIEDLMEKCFGFYMAIIFQLVHISVNYIFIIYMNFFRSRFTLFSKLNAKKGRKKPSFKFSQHHKKDKTDINTLSEFLEQEDKINQNVTFSKSDYIITLKRVMKSRTINGRKRIVLKKVNMKFRKNKITTIIGPNGSGKTTLLKIISGVWSLTSGNITINGKSVSTNATEAYSYVNKYIDKLQIFCFLLVSEYFELIIYKNSVDDFNVLHHRLMIFVDICKIQKYLNVYIRNCPVSILKMVKIICTFLSEKSVIVLDDPMSGLDFVLMQNVCALFAHQKNTKTIIFTSCDSNVVEYVTDSVIVLINGRKVSQSDIENFRFNKMLYKLVCSLEPDIGDYTLTRYIKQTFPLIRFDETVDGLVYFSIPQLMITEIWDLINKLDYNGSKLGVWRYKFISIGMRHLMAAAYDVYLKDRNRKRLVFSKIDILPQKIKHTMVINKKHFSAIIYMRITSFCRCPNRLVMRFLIPLAVLLIWASTTSMSHPTIFFLDTGYSKEVYQGEVTDTNQIFIACKGTKDRCKSVFANIRTTIFIRNIITVEYSSAEINDSNFQNFQNFLFETSINDYLFYNNKTLFGIYFSLSDNHMLQAIVLANNYKNRIYAYSLAESLLIYPKLIIIKQFDPISLPIQRDLIEINFLLRLVMLILFAFSTTTYRSVTQNVQKQFYVIHKLSGVKFSLLYIPPYLMDIVLYILIMCFMILIIHILADEGLTVITGNIVDIMSIYLLFVLADSSFKLLLEYLLNYNPIMIFILKCLDISVMFYLNVTYFINYVMKIQKFSFGGLNTENTILVYVDKIFKLFLPCANLNAGLKLDDSEITHLNGLLFIQWVLYFSSIFIWHCQKYRVQQIFQKVWCLSINNKRSKARNIGNENSFLYVKNVSYVKEGRSYFENINIEFQRGSIWGIIGQNNSGKTYLLDIIVGRRIPTTGGIYLYNQLIKTTNFKKKSVKIGYCSEKQYFIPNLTVEETLIYWCRIRLLPEYTLNNFVEELLSVILMSNEANTCVKDLTNNNVKKLDIALSFVGYPEIIVLDDPLASLDFLAKQGIINLIERAKSNFSTVIISCSDLSELRHTLTHIAILSNKNIEYMGSFLNAIADSRIGYYLTIFLDFEYLSIPMGNKLTELIQKSFRGAMLFKYYQFHVVYFIPFQTVADPNTTKIILFMETIKYKYKCTRFLINYDVYFSKS